MEPDLKGKPLVVLSFLRDSQVRRYWRWEPLTHMPCCVGHVQALNNRRAGVKQLVQQQDLRVACLKRELEMRSREVVFCQQQILDMQKGTPLQKQVSGRHHPGCSDTLYYIKHHPRLFQVSQLAFPDRFQSGLTQYPSQDSQANRASPMPEKTAISGISGRPFDPCDVVFRTADGSFRTTGKFSGSDNVMRRSLPKCHKLQPNFPTNTIPEVALASPQVHHLR